MDPATWSQIGNIANAGGVVVLLIGALYGGFRQWWVWGRDYRTLETDRDEWKALALRGMQTIDKATQAVVHVAAANHKVD